MVSAFIGREVEGTETLRLKTQQVTIAGLPARRLRGCFGVVLVGDPQSSAAITKFVPGIKGWLECVTCLEA